MTGEINSLAKCINTKNDIPKVEQIMQAILQNMRKNQNISPRGKLITLICIEKSF